MSGKIKRRYFLKIASVIGTSVAISNPVPAGTTLFASDDTKIKNSFFTIFFDRKKGRFDILRNNGPVLLKGATVSANLKSANRSIASSNYHHNVTTSSVNDELGEGRKLTIISNEKGGIVEFETRISIYNSLEAVTIETICKNISRGDLVLNSLEPVRAVENDEGYLQVPSVAKCITNGEMYFDAGIIHDFSAKGGHNSLTNLKGIKLSNSSVSSKSETLHSWWNVGFFSGYDNEGIVAGYLENNLCLGNLLVARTDAHNISLLAESVYAPELLLRPGKSRSSGRLMINIASNPYSALEAYANAVGKLNHARTGKVINGWCSWFYTLAQVSEREVIVNTEFAAKHLKGYGLEYIQIDEGYQRWHGDWEGNERFPHGMKWMAEKIKSYGFKAGIWISPYVVSEPTKLFKEHPEWLVKKSDGSLLRVGNWPENTEPPADENPKRYALDITHPDAAKWLHDLINTVANEWGYEMIKIDFVAWSILSAPRYHDPTVSSAEVYRKGMDIMRKAAGDRCHILECGPGAVTVGLIDSMRIELDINYGFSEAAWKTYFDDPASSISAMGKRYYFHKRTWINDADHICLNLLNNQQSEAAATLIGMSGGNMISGDRITQLEPHKLEILKKITPSFGEAAVPVDLFDSEMQSVFALKIKKPFGEWTVAGFFNPSLTETVERKFPVRRLWLDAGKTYLAFDFWKQKFAGEIRDEIKLSVAPGTVVLLALHEKLNRPQLLSTDRHVLQGAIEIEQLDWNEKSQSLSGLSSGPLKSSHNVYIYVPGDHPWTWGGYVLYQDYDSYSLKLVDKNIIQVNVRFEKSERIDWSINPADFFKQ